MWMISMKAVLDIVSQYCPDDDGSCSKAGVDLREMLDEIEGLDETEVQPVKQGRWIVSHTQKHVEVTYECSECQHEVVGEYEKTPFCGGCGARMDGDYYVYTLS